MREKGKTKQKLKELGDTKQNHYNYKKHKRHISSKKEKLVEEEKAKNTRYSESRLKTLAVYGSNEEDTKVLKVKVHTR